MKHVLPKTLKARLILILLLYFQKDKTFTEQLPWSQNIREHNFFFLQFPTSWTFQALSE